MAAPIIVSGVTSSNEIVLSGGSMLIEAGGVVKGLTVDPHGTVIGSFGVISSTLTSGVTNGGLIETAGGTDAFLAIYGNLTNSATVEAVATGAKGWAEIYLSGGTINNTSGTIEAAATAANTQAYVDLIGNIVNTNGHIVASGNARVAIDGANISGGTLATAGGGVIGVFGGGSATVKGASVAAGSLISDNGALTFLGGRLGKSDKLEVADGGSLTLSGMAIAAADTLLAQNNGRLAISGGVAFGSGALVEANSDGAVTVSAGNAAIVNSGIVAAEGESFQTADLSLNGGTVTNAKGAVIEAQGNSGSVQAQAHVELVGSGSVVNSGTIEATVDGIENEGIVNVSGSAAGFTVSNTGTIEAASQKFGAAQVNIVASGGITNTGTMKATATGESDGLLVISANTANVINSGTIETVATSDGPTGTIFGAAAEIGGGSLSNYGTIASIASASDGTNEIEFTFLNTVDNFKTMEALATAGGSAALGGSAGSFVNSGTVLASAGNDSYADIGLIGGITNIGTVEAAASGGSSLVYFHGTVVNDGTLLASETGGGSAFIDLSNATVSGGRLKTSGPNAAIGLFVSGGDGFITNANIAANARILNETDNTLTISGVPTFSAGTLVEAVSGRGVLDVFGAALVNSGTMEASARDGADTTVRISAGGILQNDSSIAGVATTRGAEAEVLVSGGAEIVNNAIISGSGSADADVFVVLDTAGILNNAKTIEASASNYGFASLLIGASTIINSGTMKVTASNSSIQAGLTISASTIINSGVISVAAAGNSEAEAEFEGLISNSGTIAALATSDSLAELSIDDVIINAGSKAQIYLSGNAFADLENGTSIVGGTLKTSGPTAMFEVDNGSDVAIAGATVAAGARFNIKGNLTLGADTIGKGATMVAGEGGLLSVTGLVSNAGTLSAGFEGEVDVASGAAIVGSGSVMIGDGAVAVDSGGSATVTFVNGGTGGLILADTGGNPGASDVIVSGFGGLGGQDSAQFIDLTNVAHAGTITTSFDDTGGTTSGILVVSSGSTVVADITLIGNYTHAVFVTSALPSFDFGNPGSVEIMDPAGGANAATGTLASTAPPAAGPSLVNYVGASNALLFGSYMAALFAPAEGSVAATSTEGTQSHAMITRPNAG